MRIYQLISQNAYKEEFEYRLDDLKFILNIGKDAYKHYGLFKQRALNVAKKEIEKKTPIRFEFKEIKEGRKVVSIRFLIKHMPKRDYTEKVNEEEPETKDIFTDYPEESQQPSFQDIKRGTPNQPTLIPKVISAQEVPVY